MSTLIADMTMSVDGFVAFKNDDPGPIFEWYTTGPVEIETANPGVTLRTDAKSAEDLREMTSQVGALLTGILAQKALNSAGNNGLLFGNPMQLVWQLVGVLAAGAYSAIVTYVILKVVHKLVGLRVTTDEEREGLDHTLHGSRIARRSGWESVSKPASLCSDPHDWA